MNNLEKRIAAIEARNVRVEDDKRWETSWTRRLSVAVLTYFVVLAYLGIVVHNDRPLINAFVPGIGYLLSTAVMQTIRTVWTRHR